MMLPQPGWPPEVKRELALAKAARHRGQEGRARVCARRAAGVAARIYLERHGLSLRGTSVLDRLRELDAQPELDPAWKRRIALLLLRVDPNFKLPEGTDLIAEAEALCQELLQL